MARALFTVFMCQKGTLFDPGDGNTGIQFYCGKVANYLLIQVTVSRHATDHLPCIYPGGGAGCHGDMSPAATGRV